MKKILKNKVVSILAILAVVLIVSCDGGAAENSPAVQNATKAFQIGSSNESYDTLKLAVQALIDKPKSETKAASESYTIRLNWDKTDAGATISGIDAEVKIDFQGHTLTLSDGSEGIVIANTGKAVEIANGTVQVAEGATLKSGTTAVITASTDTTLSASVNATNAAADAIATTGGNFNIQGSAQIISRSDKKTISATESAVVKINSSQVILTGGMKLGGKADVDLGDATLKLTQDIEKGDECKLEVKAENIEPQNENVHQDKIDEARHNHTFSDELQTDTERHWREATCEHTTIKVDEGLHEWDDGIVTTKVTHTNDGERTYTCSVCHQTKTELIPADADAHTFSDEWTYDADYHWHAPTCEHDIFSDKTSHSWDEGLVTTEPTHTEDGEKTYTCTICGNTKTEAVLANVDNHIFSDEWTTDNTYHWHEVTCEHDVVPDKTEHTWSKGLITKESTFTEEGIQTFTCTICGRTKSEIIPIKPYEAYFNVEHGYLTLKEGMLPPSVVVIPEFINGIAVKAIKDNAFSDCDGLTSITIPDSVTSIGARAFFGCTGLTSIIIPESVKSIGAGAFSGCTSLTSLVIPNSVTSIKESVFRGCSGLTSITLSDNIETIESYLFENCTGLTSITISNSVGWIKIGAFYNCTGLTNVTIPNSVRSIGDNAFCNCTSLTSITIPDSVTSINERAFSNCTTLNINVDIGNNAYSSENGILYDKNKTSLLRFCHATGNVEILSNVTSIGSYAFSGCTELTSIKLPDSVTSIKKGAFSGCTGLTSMSLPNSVIIIEDNTFSGCTSLTSITIPSSVISIGSQAFSGCAGLTSVALPDNLISIGQQSFVNCTGLTSITIPDSVTSIGNGAFSNCENIKYITLSENLRKIEDRTFSHCTNLLSITIPESVTSIGEYVFTGCSNLTNVLLPNSITKVGDRTFYSCQGLTSIMIPNSVTSIGVHAFYECTNLKSIIIPDSVTSIGFAFVRCYSMRTVFYSGTEEQWNNVSGHTGLVSGLLGATIIFEYNP